MRRAATFIRVLFLLLSILILTTFAVGVQLESSISPYIWGSALGLAVGSFLIFLDIFFIRFHLRVFNTALVGLFLGYFMVLALSLVFKAVLDICNVHHFVFVQLSQIFLYLVGIFLGLTMSFRGSSDFLLSIPFVRFSELESPIKNIVLDLSALSDLRMIDLATSGLLDNRLVVPNFLLKELHQQKENSDEITASKAKRSLEIVKKLEALPQLRLRYQDTDFLEAKDVMSKVFRLARLLDSDVITAEMNRSPVNESEGVRIINLHSLAHALKPAMQRGEFLKIKVQKYGREDCQGIGYLEDGTMVVINRGGDFLGKTIKARVLSVNPSAAGRMIFCNVAEEEN